MHSAPWHASGGGKEAGWPGAEITAFLEGPYKACRSTIESLDPYKNGFKFGRKQMFHLLIQYQRADSLLGQFAGTILQQGSDW